MWYREKPTGPIAHGVGILFINFRQPHRRSQGRMYRGNLPIAESRESRPEGGGRGAT